MNCPQCESVMLVEVFGTSNPIRCASCGNISLAPNKKSSDVHTYAWRSLWLGLASILLLFLTGIPAIWYGVRSLLRMRFVRSQPKDRKAAIAGVALGVIFGIAGTALVGLVGGIIAIVVFSIEETKDPERINEILATIGSLDVPSGFEPLEGNRFARTTSRVVWRDGSNAKDADALMWLIEQSTELGSPQVSISNDRFRIDRNMEVDAALSEVETLSWEFLGQNRNVTRTVESAKEGGFRSVRYGVKIDAEDKQKVHLLVVCIREPGKYAEEDVKKIFESLRLKE